MYLFQIFMFTWITTVMSMSRRTAAPTDPPSFEPTTSTPYPPPSTLPTTKVISQEEPPRSNTTTQEPEIANNSSVSETAEPIGSHHNVITLVSGDDSVDDRKVTILLHGLPVTKCCYLPTNGEMYCDLVNDPCTHPSMTQYDSV